MSVGSRLWQRARVCIADTSGLLITALFLALVQGAHAADAHVQAEIHALTGVIEGHEVGGISVDMTGIIYAADFGDNVWRITPEGQRTLFARGLYGTAGNAIDAKGHLLQASYYADEVVSIDRTGQVRPFASGLKRPAGIAVNKRTGDVFITNCGDNTVAKVASDGQISVLARSPLFDCPYGITLDRKGTLFVANYNDNRVLQVSRAGAVSVFASVSNAGLAHLCSKGDRLYVAAFRSHAIHEIATNATVSRLVGSGARGTVDGAGEQARLSFPFGIGCHPWAPRLYVNEEPNEREGMLPRRSMVRIVELAPQETVP